MHFTPWRRLRKPFRVLRGIVNVFYDNVFESGPYPVGNLKGPDEIDDLSDRVEPVDGHETRPCRVIGGIERYGNTCGLEWKRPDAVYEPHRRDGDPPVGKIETYGFLEDCEGRENIIEVVHRLTHTHKNDVGNPSLVVLPEIFFYCHNLAHDLRGGEVAFEADLSRDTEFAAHPAADLRGDTECVPLFFRHEDTLDDMSLVHCKGKLSRTIARQQDFLDFEQFCGKHVLEDLPEALGDIRHLMEIKNTLCINPCIELPRPELFLAQGTDSSF